MTSSPSHNESRVAVVTGASSGIGLALAKRLIANRYRVVANSRNIIAAGTLRRAHDLMLVNGDIRNPKTAERVVDAALQRFGRLDLLINNAGVFIPKPFTGYTPDDFRTVTETNLAGFFYVSQPAVAQMRVQKSGHVVNITASIANQPVAGLPATLASLTKGGLESVVRALAIEFAGEGVRFNATRCRGDGVPRRDLSCATKLDRTSLSQAHVLPSGRQGRALRGVGTAATLF
jgi:NAD(P)-dependent dehydrogenase (short-subunit alcohol dehydrogenase family)